MKVRKMIYFKILVKINHNLIMCKKISIKEVQIKSRNKWMEIVIQKYMVFKNRIMNIYKAKTLKKSTYKDIKKDI